MINPLDPEELRRRIGAAAPFPYCAIDDFLEPDFARRVHDAFPTYEDALRMGRVFRTVNEKKKVQITDPEKFATPILELNRLLAAPAWLETLAFAFGIPKLLADDQLVGGGIHQTGPSGRLDVHVDFNYIADRQLHRRLNILIFFNPDWKPEWGGSLELWDKNVQRCHHSFLPRFNRCVIFETSDISFHGVTAVYCPDGLARRSFAAYYYTKEAPAHWTGEAHSTVFRARPGEMVRGRLLMPAEHAVSEVRQGMRKLRQQVKKVLKPPAQG